ncbi:hypothetical protein WA158_000071 [Blastocystis sp. Blastoise]
MYANYIKCKDPVDGNIYYFCKDMNVATWTIPDIQKDLYSKGPVNIIKNSVLITYFVKAKYDFDEEGQGTVSIKRSDVLQVIRLSVNGWLGVINTRTEQTGYVPQDYTILILPPGIPPRTSFRPETPSKAKIRMSLMHDDFRSIRNSLTQSLSKTNFQASKRIGIRSHPNQYNDLHKIESVSASPEGLLYKIYADGILNGQKICPQALSYLERYRNIHKISKEEHEQVLIDIGWNKSTYIKLLVDSGTITPSDIQYQQYFHSPVVTPNRSAFISPSSCPTTTPSTTTTATTTPSQSMIHSLSPTITNKPILNKENQAFNFISPNKISNNHINVSSSSSSSSLNNSIVHHRTHSSSNTLSSNNNNINSKNNDNIHRKASSGDVMKPKEDASTPRSHLRSQVSMDKLKTQIDLDSSDDYSFYSYAKMSFQRDMKKGVFTKVNINDLINYSTTTPLHTLNVLKGSNIPEALELCSIIMKYMGDLPETGGKTPADYKNTLKISTMYSFDLLEESLCFCIKQTNNNPFFEREVKGWELIAFLLSVKSITNERVIYPYLLHIIADNIYRHDEVGGLALFSFKYLVNEEKSYSDDIINVYKNRICPLGVFDCTLEETYYLEDIADLLNKYNAHGYIRGNYGSKVKPMTNKQFVLTSDSCIKMLFNGTSLMKKLRTSKIYKERHMWISPFFNFICWKNPNTHDRIKMQSINHAVDLVTTPPPTVSSTSSDLLVYATRSFSVLFDNEDEPLDLVAINSMEKSRWYELLKVLICWNMEEGKKLNTKLFQGLNESQQDDLFKILREQDVTLYGKDIINMQRELQNSFKEYIDKYMKIHQSTIGTYSLDTPRSILDTPLTSCRTHVSILSPATFHQEEEIEGRTHTANSSSNSSNNTFTSSSLTTSSSSLPVSSLSSSSSLLPSLSSTNDTNKYNPHPLVPRIVLCLGAALRKVKAYQFEGVFRIPGSKAKIDQYAALLSQGHYEVLGEILDPYLLGSILKNWFRSLKEPVIPIYMYFRALKIQSDSDALQFIKDLPECNRAVFIYICRLLKNYCKYNSLNKMTPDTFATCISPNLLRMPITDESTVMQQELLNMLPANAFISRCITVVEADTSGMESDDEEEQQEQQEPREYENTP